MFRNLVSSQVNLILEHNELLFFTGRVSTQMMLLTEVFSQRRIILEDVLTAVLVTNMTGEVFSPAVTEQSVPVEESLFAK